MGGSELESTARTILEDFALGMMARRESMGMSVPELGDACRLSAYEISRIECGSRLPSMYTAVMIALALDAWVDELIDEGASMR